MAADLEYVVTGALLHCNKGTMPSPFKPTNGEGISIDGLTTSNTLDKEPNKHIMPFGVCSMQYGKPCNPIPIAWQNTYGVKINGGKTLLKRSCIDCSIGGHISFLNSGQIPIPQDELDKLLIANGETDDDSSWGWWDTAELIPVVGNVIGMIREADKGNWGMFALNVGFLVLDIATLGTASLATASVKGGIKAGIKTLAKQTAKKVTKATSTVIAKSGVKKLTKEGVKTFAKGIAKTTAKLATNKGITCVTACFKKGTLIASKNGQIPIEAIKAGDWVWAYDEINQKQALKKVISTFSKEVAATVELTLKNETITTTAEHPFFTQQGWKEAAALTPQDQIITKQGKWHRIKQKNFAYQKERVYNFEVADYHTYFVGTLMWLVHNAKACLHTLAKAGITYAKNMLNGQLFDKAMRKAYGFTNTQIKMTNGKVLDVLTSKEMISHKFTQFSEISFDTAKQYVNEIGNKYANQMTKSKKLTKQISTHDKKKILEVPLQKNKVPTEILKYAEKMEVEIREISGEALKQFNKINFW